MLALFLCDPTNQTPRRPFCTTGERRGPPSGRPCARVGPASSGPIIDRQSIISIIRRSSRSSSSRSSGKQQPAAVGTRCVCTLGVRRRRSIGARSEGAGLFFSLLRFLLLQPFLFSFALLPSSFLLRLSSFFVLPSPLGFLPFFSFFSGLSSSFLLPYTFLLPSSFFLPFSFPSFPSFLTPRPPGARLLQRLPRCSSSPPRPRQPRRPADPAPAVQAPAALQQRRAPGPPRCGGGVRRRKGAAIAGARARGPTVASVSTVIVMVIVMVVVVAVGIVLLLCPP